MIRLLLVVTLTAISVASADFRTYEASIDEATWRYQGSAVHCELRHTIPVYGEAIIHSRASRSANMSLVLDSLRNRLTTGDIVEVQALPSAWQPGRLAENIGFTTIIPGEKTLNLQNESVWKVLIALERGMTPAFYYKEMPRKESRVAVSLSAVNFQSVYQDFLSCVEALLPYDFREIKHTMVNFDFNRSELDKSSKEKLMVLAEFLKHDPEIDSVMIEGHTDSIALRRYNKALGLRRANQVKQFLINLGVEKDKISIRSYGERRPLESNATEEGRALNRRAFITMKKI